MNNMFTCIRYIDRHKTHYTGAPKATRKGIYLRKANPKRTLGEKLGEGNAERGIILKVVAYATVVSHKEREGRQGRRQACCLWSADFSFRKSSQ